MQRRKPGPVLRTLLRLPILIYRAGLGGLLGHRFVMITHRGRRTGRTLHTVVEVVRYDRATGEIVVASAWGRRSDWLRNILATPALAVTCGRRRFAPVQRLLDVEESVAAMRQYASAHPADFRAILRFIGQPAAADLRAVAKVMPLVSFRPPAAG